MALRHVANWHKYAIQLEFTEQDVFEMQREAQRMVDALKSAFASVREKWLFVKVHYLLHYASCIIRAGAPCEYNAQMWEQTHKKLIKDVFRRSSRNMSYFTRFATDAADLREAVEREHVPPRHTRQNMTAKKRAEMTGKCSFPAKGYNVQATAAGVNATTPDDERKLQALKDVRDLRRNGAFESLFGTALSQVFSDDISVIGVFPDAIQFDVFSSMTIPADPHPQAPSKTTVARAAASFSHGETAYFSDLAVLGVNNLGEEEVWFGHVICFLRGPASLQNPHETADYVYLRWYMVERTDQYTGLPELRLAEEYDNAIWGLVSVDSVLRPVHVVDKWGTGQWQVNLDAVV